MTKSLQQQIEEEEKALSTTTEGDDDDRGHDKSGETSRTKRLPAGTEDDETNDEGTRRGRNRGRRGRPQGGKSQAGGEGDDEDSPRSPSGDETSQDDGRSSRKDGSSPRRDVRTPRSPTGRTDSSGKAGRQQLDDETVDVEDEENPDDHVSSARLRRENRELRARMKALEEGRAPVETRQPEQKKPDAQVVNKDPEPDQAKDPTAWMQWKIRKQDEQLSALTGKTVQTERERELATVETAAVGELQEISKRYMRKNPDYAPAVLFAEREYGKALKMQNPNMSVDDINAFMKKEMLRLSVGWVAKGLDPAEEIYDMCIERFGYVPNSGGRREQQFKEDNGEEARNPTGMRRKSPDLRVVNNNRRRSASPLQGSGQGGSPHMSKEAAADMTLGEMAQFDQADWDALERMG